MRSDQKQFCDVCLGVGTYPVINRHGEDLYVIPCPECSPHDLARMVIATKIDGQRLEGRSLAVRKDSSGADR